MEKLLKWSLESQAHDPASGREVPKPDAKALSQLFGGVDEATLMKEAVAVATNPSAEEEAKLTALDNLEQLVESLDNANDLENLGLWKPLVEIISDKNCSSDVQAATCWVIGTAVQNNPKSQAAFALQEGAIDRLVTLSQSNDTALANKALYALSNAIRHFSKAYDQFVASEGWKVLDGLLASSNCNKKVRVRSISLIDAIAHTEPFSSKIKQLEKTSIVDNLFDILTTHKSDLGASEKALRALHLLSTNGLKLTSDQKDTYSKAKTHLVENDRCEHSEFQL